MGNTCCCSTENNTSAANEFPHNESFVPKHVGHMSDLITCDSRSESSCGRPDAIKDSRPSLMGFQQRADERDTRHDSDALITVVDDMRQITCRPSARKVPAKAKLSSFSSVAVSEPTLCPRVVYPTHSSNERGLEVRNPLSPMLSCDAKEQQDPLLRFCGKEEVDASSSEDDTDASSPRPSDASKASSGSLRQEGLPRVHFRSHALRLGNSSTSIPATTDVSSLLACSGNASDSVECAPASPDTPFRESSRVSEVVFSLQLGGSVTSARHAAPGCSNTSSQLHHSIFEEVGLAPSTPIEFVQLNDTSVFSSGSRRVARRKSLKHLPLALGGVAVRVVPVPVA
jgi:hypothetical protein